MSQVTRRRLSRELMDDPNADRAELADALAWLRTINRKFGGVDAVLKRFKRWSRDWSARSPAGGKPIRILDVGTGSADIPLAIAHWAREAGHRVHITAIDLHPTTVELARQQVSEASGSRSAAAADQGIKASSGPRPDLPPIAVLQADALKLMDIFEPGEFDYAHAGLFLHHLNDAQVMAVLQAMDHLAMRGVIWNDLERGWVGAIGVRWLMLRSGVPRMVRNDAIVSVRAGFTRREAMGFAQHAGLTNLSYRRHMLHRFTLVSEKG